MRTNLILCSCLLLAACSFQEDVALSTNAASALVDPQGQHLADLELIAPLTSAFESPTAFDHQASAIELMVTIPPSCSSKLGCGVYVADDEGHWLHRFAPQAVGPGTHHLRFSLQDALAWSSAESPEIYLSTFQKQMAKTFGCYFWSEEELSGSIEIHVCRLMHEAKPKQTEPFFIHNLQLDGMDERSGHVQVQTGQRWQCQFRPEPLPFNPYASKEFQVDLQITDQSRQQQLVVPGFFNEPVQLQDRGNAELATTDGQGYFCVRYRPQKAGLYQLQLHCRWQDQERYIPLPDMLVTGEDWDDFVRTDPNDPRFLQLDGEFFWPTGINLKSANDDWCASYLRTIKTPSLGTYTYEHYLSRLKKAGGNYTEIWMCNWNLALEWFDDWESYRGLAGYSAKHAQQLDQILDSAYEKNIRVILSFRNHGQGHTRSGNRNIPSDTNEWHYNPYNKDAGGFLGSAVELFSHEESLRRQEDLHRYIVARYADHPAIMMWKLWSEVDLTDAAKEDSHRRFDSTPALVAWHKRMSAQISALDVYDHLICAHYSTDFHRVDTKVYKLPKITASCINAYLWRLEGHYGKQYTLAQLLYDSCNTAGAFKLHSDVMRDLRQPIIVSEYGGGNPFRMTEDELWAHHESAPWAAFLSGHASGPLFFWYEWIDQRDHWRPLSAVKRFAEGEDLRSGASTSRPVLLSAQHARQRLWSCAWVRPGRILAYVMDKHWGAYGNRTALIEQAHLHIGKNVKSGAMHVEWWDASQGARIGQQRIQHPGGKLTLTMPAFRRHLACKIWRIE